MLVAGIIIMIMYIGLVFCIAEMAPALPHTGAAYSFARSAMGPWGGFITGLCENVEYVLTPAVIVLLHRLLHGGHFRDAGELPAHMVGVDVRRVSGAEHRRRGTFVPRDLGGHARGACGARHLLGQCHSAHGFQPLGAEHRAGWRRAAGRERPVSSRSAFMASSPRCPSRCGCSWRSSNFRSRRRNRSIRSATCRRGIILGMLTLIVSAAHDRVAQSVGRSASAHSRSASRASRCSTASAPSTGARRRKSSLSSRSSV